MRLHNAKTEEQGFLEEVQRINREINGPEPSATLSELAAIYARAIYRAYNEGYQDALQDCRGKAVKMS